MLRCGDLGLLLEKCIRGEVRLDRDCARLITRHDAELPSLVIRYFLRPEISLIVVKLSFALQLGLKLLTRDLMSSERS